jgi:hypothetical protein
VYAPDQFTDSLARKIAGIVSVGPTVEQQAQILFKSSAGGAGGASASTNFHEFDV